MFALVVCTPLLLILHKTGIEPLFPLPTNHEMTIILVNGLIGTILCDYLWLYASVLTSPLTATVSLTLSVPLSMIADASIRERYPTRIELIAAAPIMVVSGIISLYFLRQNDRCFIVVCCSFFPLEQITVSRCEFSARRHQAGRAKAPARRRLVQRRQQK